MDGVSVKGRLRGSLGRSRRALSQLWQVPMFLFGLTAFVLVAASAPYREELFDVSFSHDLQTLRSTLQAPRAGSALVTQAERLLPQLDKHPRRAAEIHYLVGSAYFYHTAFHPGDTASRERALHHLQQAIDLGVPDADHADLLHRLGVLILHQGDTPRAIALLNQGAELGATQRADAYRLLVEAHLALPEPDIDAALAASKRLLETSTDLEAVGQTRLLRGQLLVRKQQRIDALKELDQVGNVSLQLRTQARLLQADICAQQGLWHRAATVWKELLPDAGEVPGGKGRICYELGHCLTQIVPPNYAAAATAWREAAASAGPESQAAQLRLGELHLYYHDYDAAQGLGYWRTALASVDNPEAYHNTYVDLAKARRLFDQACRIFFEQRDYVHMEQAATLYRKIAAPGVAEERLAEAAEAQAQRHAKNADGKVDAEAKAHFRRAGAAYEAAAAAYEGSRRIEPYWRSALCFLAAHDHQRATDVLETYVTLEKDEPRLAQAFYSLAEANTALGRTEQAQLAYYKCMEFPTTPYAYRARYQLAVAEIEKKNFAHAKEILKQNLTSASPAMDRAAHEKSIYKMAGLLVQMKAHDEAAWYLKEASRQYPHHPNALYARDLLADSYAQLAAQAKAKIEGLGLSNLRSQAPEEKLALAEMRSHHQRTRRTYLDLGVSVYQGLAEELERRSREQPLSANELMLLRRALFGVADLRFELNEFHEALRLYQGLQQKYRMHVEGLIACERIWKCVGVIVEPPEQARQVREAARNAVTMAQADLEKMPAESDVFRGAGVWSKQEWQAWLRWVSNELDRAAAPLPRPNPLAGSD